jgi:hypothetical protein
VHVATCQCDEQHVSDQDADGDEVEEGPAHAADACSAGW